MTFSDPLVADTTLIRPAIQSPDYVPGVAGWQINADGNAEFNDATVRGELEVRGEDGSWVRVYVDPVDGPVVELRPSDSVGSGPVTSPVRLRGGDGEVSLIGPSFGGGGQGQLMLGGSALGSRAELSARTTLVEATTVATVSGARVNITGGASGVHITGLQPAVPKTAMTLLGAWVNYAAGYQGARFEKTADQWVSLSGAIKNGTVATDATGNAYVLPAGCLPAAVEAFAVATATGFGRVEVHPTGDVRVYSGGNAFVSLSGVRFLAAA